MSPRQPPTLLLALLLSLAAPAAAQQDSAAAPLQKDTIATKAPVVRAGRFLARLPPAGADEPTYGRDVFGYIIGHPYFNFDAPPVSSISGLRNPPPTDWIFYLFTGCLFLLGLLRMAFPRYVDDMFKVFFNIALKQKQLREQLSQDALPALLLNGYAMVSGGLFLYFLTRGRMAPSLLPEWGLIPGFILLLSSIYAGKLILLRFAGWVFGRQSEADGYLFMVLLVNKMAGIFLLPMTILLATFGPGENHPLLIPCGLLLAFLLLFRLLRCYDLLHKDFRITFLQYFLYFLAFEALPVLLLAKALSDVFFQ